MKIAVPVTNTNQIDDHFGHCEFYNVYTIIDGKIKTIDQIKSEQGCGCKSNIAKELAEKSVTLMLAGGIGNGAVNKLNNEGITVIRGCSGKPEQNVNQYIEGSLIDSGVNCQHHNEHHEHVCKH
jgi:predicted Fe-Mo cluster-binding NifX family protein